MTTSPAASSENRLARAIQSGVPFTDRPFEALGRNIGMSENDVLHQLRTWQGDGRLREISAVLEGAALGHESALVASSVHDRDIDAVADIVGAHPMVTHSYRREHHYNLWFTISVPYHMGLSATLRVLEYHTGVDRLHPLRRTHTFKIGVNFDLDSRENRTVQDEFKEAVDFRPSETEKLYFRLLQTPLPIEHEPFAKLARGASVDAAAMLDFARRQTAAGIIRRYVGTFRHRRLGVNANGMAVWAAPDRDLARVGAALAREPEVSHCYAREAMPGFAYRLYTMLHGPNREAVEGVARRMAEAHALGDYLVLFSTHEYKKCRLRYFLPSLDAWWAVHTNPDNGKEVASCSAT